jgi:RHS repeat-associated protein
VYSGLPTGTPLDEAIVCYNGAAFSTCKSPATAVKVPFSSVRVYTAVSGGATSSVLTTLNAHGLPTELDRYDFDGTNKVRRVVGFGTGGICNNTPPVPYAYDRTCDISIFDPTNSGTTVPVSDTVTVYEQGTGNLTQIQNMVSQLYLFTYAQYNSNGTLKQVQDPNGTWTYMQYDGSCGSLLPTSTSNSFNTVTTSTSYDSGCKGAVQTSTTGPDGVPVKATYNDPLWRADTTTARNGLVTTFSWPTLNTQEALSLLNTTSGVDVLTTTDGLGRTIAVQTRQSPSSDSYDTVTTSYDRLGRVSAVTEPFTATKCDAALGCWGTGARTTYTYFADGKPHVVTDANLGTVTYSYPASTSFGLDVVSTLGPAAQGENVKSKQLEFDGLGRLKSVCEITSQTGSISCGQANGGTGFPTAYLYDAVGRVKTVNQGIQQRQFVYDGIGRIVYEKNPEDEAHSYYYDSFGGTSSLGDLIAAYGEVTDTRFTYDGLHRMVSKTYGTNDAITDTVGFSYDFGTNGGGRLTEAWTCAAGTVPCPVSSAKTAETFGYDSLGNVTAYNQHSPRVPGNGWYTATETFDAFGNLLTLNINGSGFLNMTAWDGEARPTVATNDTGSISLQSAATYGPFGPTSVTYGNGDVVTTGYDNIGHINYTKLDVGGLGTSTAINDVTWNANGTVYKVRTRSNLSGTATDVTATYLYDDLMRISSASSTDGNLNQTFAYDRYGNITATSGTPNMYTAGVDSATNRLTANADCGTGQIGPCYDHEGRLTIAENDDTIYTWDANGKLVGSDTNVYMRDAFGREVENPNTLSIWAPAFPSPMRTDNYGHMTLPLPGGSSVHWSGGCSCGQEFSNFSHPDYLGNITASTNYLSAGHSSVWRYRSYAPFGQEFNVGNGYGGWDGGADGFDGLDNVEPAGLWDTPARKLDSVAGRWISPDPAGRSAASPGSPQSWNRYAYASNMPTVMSDPSGLCDWGSGTTSGEDVSSAGPCPNLEDSGSENSFGIAYNAGNMLDPNANWCSICTQAMNDSVDMNGPETTPLADALASAGDPAIPQSAQQILGQAGQMASPSNFLGGMVSVVASDTLYDVRAIGVGIDRLSQSPTFQLGAGIVAVADGLPEGEGALSELSEPFTRSGELTSEAIANSKQIMDPSKLGNPSIPGGFAKYSTRTFTSPSGPFQVHFYKDPTSLEVFYGLDYKVVFNKPLGFNK